MTLRIVAVALTLAPSALFAQHYQTDFPAEDLRARYSQVFEQIGSDCSCTNGHGGGVSQNNNPTAARMAGKCVARETLSLLKRTTAPELFEKIVWGNVHKLLRIPA